MIQEVSLTNNSPLSEKGRPCLYQDVDEQQLQKDAEACLANYGTKFESQIMTGSNGLYVYTARGTRVLDWTVSAYASKVDCIAMLLILLSSPGRCLV
jgi:hypothetical protein